jgi:Ca2+-binding EF-hand superfamily protein
MRKPTNTTWLIAILTVLIATGILLTTAAAQKASVPKAQDRLTMGEAEVRQLLQLMEPNQKGMVSKQEYMNFMEAEFEQLDRNKKGELDVRQLTQSNLSASHFAGK